METVNRLNTISTTIENLKTFESGLGDIKIAPRGTAKEKHRRDLLRERALSGNCVIHTFTIPLGAALYNAPGKLVIDIGSTGFRFDVEIERSGSSGISNMKVFCYDLMLASLWADRKRSPKLCVHDSTIFDGVDERQRALALEIAASEALQCGFQYICTLNSNYVAWAEFSKEFDLKKYIKLILTDESPDGCLLGIHLLVKEVNMLRW